MRVFPLSSSMLRYLGYDLETKTLLAGFHTHTWYRYHDVPKEVFAEVLIASSQGSAFDRLVKKGSGYKYERVDVSVTTEAKVDGFGAHEATIIEKDKTAQEAGAQVVQDLAARAPAGPCPLPSRQVARRERRRARLRRILALAGRRPNVGGVGGVRMSRNRPPATQGEILRLLEEGWELGVDSTFAASIWLQKDGLGRGGETREVNGSSFSALKRKGLIWQIKYGFPSSLWGLIKTPALPVKYD